MLKALLFARLSAAIAAAAANAPNTSLLKITKSQMKTRLARFKLHTHMVKSARVDMSLNVIAVPKFVPNRWDLHPPSLVPCPSSQRLSRLVALSLRFCVLLSLPVSPPIPTKEELNQLSTTR